MEKIDIKDETALQTLVSDAFGQWSTTVKVDQAMINDFAELSGDSMWLHVDEERCARESPFGCTIAHGFLVLSLMSKMTGGVNVIEQLEGYSTLMNYGSDKLRFVGPVPVNSEIHSRNRVKSVQVGEQKTTLTLQIHIHVVGQEKPAMIYELILVFL